MKKNKMLIMLIIILASCSNKNPNPDRPYKRKCSSLTVVPKKNIVEIMHGDSVLIKFINDSTHLVLKDTSNERLFGAIGNNLYLINCKDRSAYEYKTLAHNLPIINPSIEVVKNKYIYANDVEMYLFDSTLTLVYSTWEFIKELPDSLSLGMSGVNQSYEIYEDKITIYYKILTDVTPYLLGSYHDTVRL